MSTINTNSINVNYPVPGVNNSSQGFRDNFASIKTNLDAAGTEITDLQNAVVVKTALANTAINNDMGNTLISNASTRGFRATTFNLGSAISGTIIVNVNSGDVQYGTIAGNTTVQFAGWAPSGTQSNVQIEFTVSNANAVISWPTNVSMTGSYGIETVENFSNNAGIPTVTAAANVSQLDFRFSTVDCGNTILIEPFNRPRQSTQIQTRTPSPVGLPGDNNGAVAVDASTSLAFATVSATTTSLNTISCDSTAGLYLDMPVTFSGTTFGGITAGTTYYIRTIPSGSVFTISATPGTAAGIPTAVSLSTASGTMYVSPVSYLYVATGAYAGTSNAHQVSSTVAVTSSGIYAANTVAAGNIVQLSTTSGLAVGQPVTFGGTTSTAYLTQCWAADDKIKVSNSTGMVIGGKIVISGTTFGGITTGTFYVKTIDTPNTANSNITITSSFGGSNVNITSDATGNCTGTIGGVLGGLSSSTTYYIETIASSNITVGTTQDAVPVAILSENGNMTVTATTNYLMTLDSIAGFSQGDPIVFSGNVFGGVTAGQVYYISNVATPNISISQTRYNGITGQKVALTNDSNSNHSGVTFTATNYHGDNIWKRSEFKGW